MTTLTTAIQQALVELEKGDTLCEINAAHILRQALAEQRVTPAPYAWTVTGTAQMFFGDYAQHDAEQEAKHIGGTARAFPLFAEEPVAPTAPTNTDQWDAKLGRTAMRFVDRAGDVHPGIDDAEKICADFHAAMSSVIDEMPWVKRMHRMEPPTASE